jgi:hypothetical protein
MKAIHLLRNKAVPSADRRHWERESVSFLIPSGTHVVGPERQLEVDSAAIAILSLQQILHFDSDGPSLPFCFCPLLLLLTLFLHLSW